MVRIILIITDMPKAQILAPWHFMPKLVPKISAKCLKLASAAKKLAHMCMVCAFCMSEWKWPSIDHLLITFPFSLLIIMMLISTLMVKKPILTDNFPKQHSLFFVCIDYAAHRNFERLWLLIRDKRISGSKDLEGKIWYIVYTTLKREGNGLKLFGKRWPTLSLKNLKKTAWFGLF